MKPISNLNDFLFTQNSLQSYLDCPRQFELRYLVKQECPPLSTAAQAASRQFAALGTQFHQLLHRHFIGLPDDKLIDQQSEKRIRNWWQQFSSQNPLPENMTVKMPEVSLTCSIENARLLAKLDLIAATADHRIFIYDWKTSPNPQSSAYLKARIQTRLYPLVVSKTGQIGGVHYSPDQVTMVYWYANHPKSPVVIPYSSVQMQADETYLAKLVEEIRSLPIGNFQQTSHRQRCDYCDFFLICHKQKPPPSQSSIDIDDDLFTQPESDTTQDEEISYRAD